MSFVDDLQALKSGAAAQHDWRTAKLCELALGGDREAWQLCRRVIDEAKAIVAEAEPTCPDCGQRLARFAGPAEEQGFTCLECEGQP